MAYGRTGDAALRVGFGDDTAVAGGLWLGGDPPNFVADAVADPITGLTAAALGARLVGRAAGGCGGDATRPRPRPGPTPVRQQIRPMHVYVKTVIGGWWKSLMNGYRSCRHDTERCHHRRNRWEVTTRRSERSSQPSTHELGREFVCDGGVARVTFDGR